MSAPRSSRSWRSKSIIVPIALSVAAAATAAGVWLWLDNSHEHHHHHHTHDPSDSEPETEPGGHAGSSYSSLQSARATRRPHLPHKSSSGGLTTSSTSSSKAPPASGEPGRAPLSRVDEESDRESRVTKTYVPPARTRTVAFVVSAQSALNTLLTCLPHPLVIPQNTTVHILIYTPSLTQSAPAGSPHATAPIQPPPPSKIHDLAYQILPEAYPKEYILPYTTHPTGTSSLLRHLAPEVVYMEETLAGEDGGVLRDLISKGWVREGIVVLGTGPGAIGGKGAQDPTLAGLVDSSDEEGLEKIGYGEAGVKGKEKALNAGEKGSSKGRRWWEEPGWDGGKGGGSVLEKTYLQEDWRRRVVDRK